MERDRQKAKLPPLPPRTGSGVSRKCTETKISFEMSKDNCIPKHFTIHLGDNRIISTNLPDYGEVRIVTHAGKVTFVETTTKEKVE